MKCVCGYDNGGSFSEDGLWIERNGKDFTEVEGYFFRYMEHNRHKEVALCACPKCDTIQMVEW